VDPVVYMCLVFVVSVCRYMGIGLSSKSVSVSRLPGNVVIIVLCIHCTYEKVGPLNILQ